MSETPEIVRRLRALSELFLAAPTPAEAADIIEALYGALEICAGTIRQRNLKLDPKVIRAFSLTEGRETGT